MANLSISSPGYSTEVEQLQNNLLALGFFVSIDGYFGPETQQAVKDFQYTWGNLTIDGIVGPMTAAAIDSAINLLLEDQWNTSVDPMQIPTIPIEEWPSEMRYVTAFTSTGAPKTTTFTSIWKSIAPWSWIIVGAGVVMVIFGAPKRRN